MVENDRWIRLVMRDLLVQAGFRVAEASSGFSAIRLAEREQADAVIAQPFVIDKLLAAVSRSRQRAINRCQMRFTTSASELATRPGAVEAGAFGGACAGRPRVGAAHLLPSTRESPGNGDRFSPGCGRLLVRQREVET